MKQVTCPDCKGTGKQGLFSKCKICGGTGKIIIKTDVDNLIFIFTLSPPIDYPSQETRNQKFGKPISNFVKSARMNFSHVGVQYYQDKNDKMDRIDVTCFEPDEITAKMIDDMKKLNNPLNEFILLYFAKMYQFFKKFDTITLPYSINIPQEKTSQEWIANQFKTPLAPKGGWPLTNKEKMVDLLEGLIKVLPKS